MRLSEGLRNGLLLLVAVVSGNVLIAGEGAAARGAVCRERFAGGAPRCTLPPGAPPSPPSLRGAQSLELYGAPRTEAAEEEELLRFVFSPREGPPAAPRPAPRAPPAEPAPMGPDADWTGPAPL